MKKLLLLLLNICLLVSCTENKSVVEKLELDEVASLVKKDTLYESVILEAEATRNVIEKNIILMSKFKKLTYSDVFEYKKKITDTIMLNNLFSYSDSINAIETEKKIKIYKPKIDSILAIYKKLKEENDPANYFKAEFSSISKEYYTYSGGVKNVDIKFKINPLKGPIEGGSFRYKVIPKVTNKEVADGGCRFSSYTKQTSYYNWEAPYDVEKEFKSASTSSVKRNYYFDIEYLSVRKNGKTLSYYDLDIPVVYKIHMDKDSLNQYDYSYIIKKEFNVSIESSFDKFLKLYDDEKRKINELAFEFESIIDEEK